MLGGAEAQSERELLIASRSSDQRAERVGSRADAGPRVGNGQRELLRPCAPERQRRRGEASLIDWPAGRRRRRRASRLAACARGGGRGPSAPADEPGDPPDRRRRDRERGGGARGGPGEPPPGGARRPPPHGGGQSPGE